MYIQNVGSVLGCRQSRWPVKNYHVSDIKSIDRYVAITVARTELCKGTQTVTFDYLRKHKVHCYCVKITTKS